MLSDYSKNIAAEYEIKVGDVKDLILNLGDKTNYVLHYRNLQLYVRLVNNENDFLKYTSKPTHATHKAFNKNHVAIDEIKSVLTLNKPIYVGFTILELSKWLMCDFHWNFIEKHFDVKLLFTDTDSFTYEIKSEDVCEDFLNTNFCLTLAIL